MVPGRSANVPDDQTSDENYAVYDVHELDKQENADGVLISNAIEVDDEFRPFYIGEDRDKGLIQPPFNLRLLQRLAQEENNTLAPCVEAMVTNVDGTGFVFEMKSGDDPTDDDERKIRDLEEFFEEPWPGKSFVTMRKELRRDLEQTGMAYLEVIRNAGGEIVLLRQMRSVSMRLVRLDRPVPVDVTVKRRGQEETLKVEMRQRRYAQLSTNNKLRFFKDFGVRRELDKTTGEWGDQQDVPLDRRATEVLCFRLIPDGNSPYGLPRWISQVPSVLGSRKAEELNLNFFNSGGVPPAMIFLQGGVLTERARRSLQQMMSMGPSQKNKVLVFEVQPSGGTIDSPGNSRVSVERFGGERQSDAMFLKYDERTSEHTRVGFRVPPIFIGKAEDYSFATAWTSYRVGEEQVFAPERQEFDEIVTTQLLPALGYDDVRMRSLPIVIADISSKLEGLQMAAATGDVDSDEVVSVVNECTGLNIKVSEQSGVDEVEQQSVDPSSDETSQPQDGPPDSQPAEVLAFDKSDARASALAVEVLLAMRKRDFVEVEKNVALATSTLDQDGYAKFRQALAALQYNDVENDPEGLARLSACTLSVMASMTGG